jgi:low affinity Fe/Cu permease
MTLFDSLGSIVSSVLASIVLLVFAIVSYFITVFIVQAGAGLAGFSPSGDFVILSAAIIATGAIVAGATPVSALGDQE